MHAHKHTDSDHADTTHQKAAKVFLLLRSGRICNGANQNAQHWLRVTKSSEWGWGKKEN